MLVVAGILRGLRATTHWHAICLLPKYGADPVWSRVVVNGEAITSADIPADIDMALGQAAFEAGEFDMAPGDRVERAGIGLNRP